jgi:hypothetical protein
MNRPARRKNLKSKSATINKLAQSVTRPQLHQQPGDIKYCENNSIFENQAFIFISEFLHQSKGSDDQEFIELFNPGKLPVNLKGWKLGRYGQRVAVNHTKFLKLPSLNQVKFSAVGKPKLKSI